MMDIVWKVILIWEKQKRKKVFWKTVLESGKSASWWKKVRPKGKIAETVVAYVNHLRHLTWKKVGIFDERMTVITARRDASKITLPLCHNGWVFWAKIPWFFTEILCNLLQKIHNQKKKKQVFWYKTLFCRFLKSFWRKLTSHSPTDEVSSMMGGLVLSSRWQ